MSELATILAALALYAAAVISPGPNFTLISRLAMAGARSAAVGAMAGLAIGATVYSVLAMTGLALVVSRLGWLMTAVQIAGGCYLIYLGILMWFGGEGEADPTHAQPQPRPRDAIRGLRVGLLVELSNPKGIAFFVSIYAVAIPIDTSLWAKGVILAGGVSFEIAWYGLLTLLLSSPPVRAVYRCLARWIDRLIGTVLAAFGARLISERL